VILKINSECGLDSIKKKIKDLAKVLARRIKINKTEYYSFTKSKHPISNLKSQIFSKKPHNQNSITTHTKQEPLPTHTQTNPETQPKDPDFLHHLFTQKVTK
jgi:hypothetical protein